MKFPRGHQNIKIKQKGEKLLFFKLYNKIKYTTFEIYTTMQYKKPSLKCVLVFSNLNFNYCRLSKIATTPNLVNRLLSPIASALVSLTDFSFDIMRLLKNLTYCRLVIFI
ncbi:Hypothetical_protein [Hexamita inflata]|uniref:Hypothetical_protein n=1 Tax=Hexamita inflata TaxID=28002 RepID=A0AA86U917_9EUKA|nr:Hypothetical protein HINF_LOCUS35775 [Hexamita inflata]